MSKSQMITQQPVMKTTIPIPENRTTPDKVETSIGSLEFFDGVPVGDTKDTLVDFVQRGRAVEAFINMTPAASMYSLRQGHRDEGLTECNQILIAEQLGDSVCLRRTHDEYLGTNVSRGGETADNRPVDAS